MNVCLERFRRRKALGIISIEIDDQADDTLFSEIAAANAEAANLDQAG